MRKVDFSKAMKYLIAFLVPMLVVMGLNHELDNDSWYVLAEGRYIAENGIYHEDVLSMHEGLHAVVQNYSFAVVFYWIYSAFGASGIYLTMLLLNLLLMFLLYKICMLISNKNVKLSLILMAATDIVLAFGFIVTRAQMVDYVVFLTLIYILELFIKNGKKWYLLGIPVLSLIMINFHASTWWMLFAIMAAYIVGGIKKYKIWPLILASAISLPVGLLNPYGLEMVTSIFAGYGSMVGLNLVAELMPFSPIYGYNLVFYLALVAVLVFYIQSKNKLPVRYLLLFFGFLFLGLLSVKGFSEVILVSFFPLAMLYKDYEIPNLFDDKKIGKAITICVGVLALILAPCLTVVAANMLEDRPSQTMDEAMNTIDQVVGNRNKKEVKVFVGYTQGGYVEYRGYPAYLDPRGEYFTKAVNKKEDILREYIDIKNGKIKLDDFVSKYDFDFILVEEYCKDFFKDLDKNRYELIYDNEDDEVKVYKKIEVSNEM